MDSVRILPAGVIGRNFIPEEYLPKGKDEYYHRYSQALWPEKRWRNLSSDEVRRLVKNNNTSDNWDEIFVTDKFDPGQIKNNDFYGRVRIGNVRNVILDHHDLKVPAGITNSLIIACDIGDDVAVHDVFYLSHFIVGDRTILSNINEMHTTNHAKFGNGIIKEGEQEEVRIWLDLMNEAGCRSVLPFEGIITADAYIWAKYRDDTALQEKLKKITQESFDSSRGYYGTIGSQCVIKNSRILKDVKIGSHCYIKGVNKLKNLTINSSETEKTQIGEGVELVNGIIGFGCHVFYGCKAVRFILGDNSNLKYGARLINSFLGDNSTISCCEVLNNLIFPAHEQHHNNSFLIASVVMGQSNMAAGATIGSNHNSRANDNEIQAGRGFWPGLCVSVKHSCRFASFVLLAKADYPAELDIPLPFSLVNNNDVKGRLEVLPAYWWLYNMYALARNSSKFRNRDKRERKIQNIEFDPLAPDTAEEIIKARRLLEIAAAKASLRERGELDGNEDEDKLAAAGRELLTGSKGKIDKLEILGENMEKSKRKVIIFKVYEAYRAYSDMLHYYAVKNLIEYMASDPSLRFSSMVEKLGCEREERWLNIGGQLIAEGDVDCLRRDIVKGKLSSWKDIHERYDELWQEYPFEKQKHAFATLRDINGSDTEFTKEDWLGALERAVEIQEFVNRAVYRSRKKDFDNKFRQNTYRNIEEMNAAIGTIEDNSFVKQVRGETEDFKKLAGEISKRDS
ncbi:MAG TPA: DUF4954 family protein [Candidatus Krumholzibacteriaceae bacterium]|nr:DUF4954 family protein [Candidatus Krumholzibacteriaceae bacterium]